MFHFYMRAFLTHDIPPVLFENLKKFRTFHSVKVNNYLLNLFKEFYFFQKLGMEIAKFLHPL